MAAQIDLAAARALAARARENTSDGLTAREALPDVVDALLDMLEARNRLRCADNTGPVERNDTPDASALLERMRLVALVMYGLDGYADACEDSGQHDDAAVVRESVDEVRALLPDAADPAGIEFEWATQFTSVTGREFVTPTPCEGDALEVVLSVTPPESSRWAVMRRVVGPWVKVPVGVEAADA